MKLLIVRHGQSVNNLLYLTTGDYQGRSPDPVLTELGMNQAQALGEFVSANRLPVTPTVVMSSLFSRAIQTAHPLAERLGLPILGRLDTFEIGGPYFGRSVEGRVFAGTPASQLAKLSNRLVIPEGADDSGWYRLDHRETWAEAAIRAEKVLAEIIATYQNTDEVIALVCHQYFAQCLIREAIGMPTEPSNAIDPWFTIDNTGHALLDFVGGFPGVDNTTMHLHWLNRTDHLQEEWVSN